MSTYRDSIVSDEVRRRMQIYAATLMSSRLRQGHDPSSVVNSAEASANEQKNAHLSELDPEELVRLLLVKTRHHVLNRVGYETAQKRDMRRNQGPVSDHYLAESEPDPQTLAEWRDLWDWVQRQLQAQNQIYGQLFDLMRSGCSTAEIATELGIAQRTVQRVIRKVRDLIEKLLSPS